MPRQVADHAWVRSLSKQDLIDALERNGYLDAAANLRAGASIEEATAYAVGGQPRYEDREGELVQQYIDRLHREAP